MTEQDRDQLRAQQRTALAGGGRDTRHGDPHSRAAAAQALGDLGDAADADTLLAALCGPLADEHAMVRMECAIALGKLKYTGPGDQRRQRVIAALRDRSATDRDEGGKLLEREYMVRLSMVNSLVHLGGRSAAAAVWDVASSIAAERDSEASRGDIADKGLLDRCIQGLQSLTGVSRAEAEANRALSDDWRPHMAWWTTRILVMPEG